MIKRTLYPKTSRIKFKDMRRYLSERGGNGTTT
jgi:hypothetical protein